MDAEQLPCTPFLVALTPCTCCVVGRSQGHKGSKFNKLLVKDLVGKGRTSSYDLPSKQFTFGYVIPRDVNDAKEGRARIEANATAHVPSAHEQRVPLLATQSFRTGSLARSVCLGLKSSKRATREARLPGAQRMATSTAHPRRWTS